MLSALVYRLLASVHGLSSYCAISMPERCDVWCLKFLCRLCYFVIPIFVPQHKGGGPLPPHALLLRT